jgi:hypothetical protein
MKTKADTRKYIKVKKWKKKIVKSKGLDKEIIIEDKKIREKLKSFV